MNGRMRRMFPAVMGGAAVPWYLSGGIPAANCLAAYNAVGAASQAASYVNLANPGTYDLSAGAAPTWNTATGWTFSVGTYLRTGLSTGYKSAFAVLRNLTRNVNAAFGYYNGAADCFLVQFTDINTVFYMGGDFGDSYPLNNLSVALSDWNSYVDGQFAFARTKDGTYSGTELYVGDYNSAGSPAGTSLVGDILAISFYSAFLSSAQILALHNAYP